MRHLFLVFFFFISLYSIAEERNYSIGLIPEALLKNANVVKRTEEMQFEIISTRETVLRQRYAYTILNAAGAEKAAFREWYDALRSIEDIEGSLYDAFGKLIKRVKKKDIQDISGVSDNNLMDDSRVKQHNFYHGAYPYTIEYETVIRFNHSFYFPAWLAQDFEWQSVQHSRFEVIAPKDYVLKYRSFSYKGEPVITEQKNKKTYAWEVKNIPAVWRRFAAPDWKEYTPVVFLSPSSFELQGYKGTMDSWKNLGLFQLQLNKGRDVLPPDVVQKVKELTAGAKTDRQKVEILYQYLQKTTRYISIQLGIGGWQPFDATYVAKKGYGDCKALSNYMHSLLKTAGVPSFYTLVYAGQKIEDKNAVLDDFPARNFNHVILCVPLQKDTVWLECTDQSMPAGYMGAFTGNRKALLITDEGGKLVSTPMYGHKENLQIRSVKAVLDKDGNLDAKVHTLYTGMQQDELHSMLSYLSKDKVKKVLNEELNLSTYDINDFKYEEKKAPLPELNEQLDLYVSHYATVSGKRIFLTPNLLNRSSSRADTGERTYDYEFSYAYKDADTVEIDIPDGYAPEALPKDVLLKTKFGTYSSSVKLAGNKLFYLRVREQYSGRFPAKDKDELTRFYEAIYKSDRSRVVLVKKDEP